MVIIMVGEDDITLTRARAKVKIRFRRSIVRLFVRLPGEHHTTRLRFSSLWMPNCQGDTHPNVQQSSCLPHDIVRWLTSKIEPAEQRYISPLRTDRLNNLEATVLQQKVYYVVPKKYCTTAGHSLLYVVPTYQLVRADERPSSVGLKNGLQ